MDREFLTFVELDNLRQLWRSMETKLSFIDFKRSFGISGNSSSRILDKQKWFLSKIKHGL